MTTLDASPVSPQALEIVSTLIGFDTTSRNSNLGLIEWVRDYLHQHGVQGGLTYDPGSHKANLFATIGDRPVPGFVLSGHTDVVPVDNQAWSTDPFNAKLLDGRLYGRGSCDMKGFIGCTLAAVPKMLAEPLSTPFHLALSYDEEVGCIGVRHLLADLADRHIKPAACIVGEPTSMELVIAHKGRREVRCCVRGKEAHSSLPEMGLNAIEYGARIVTFVQRLAQLEAAHGVRSPGFDVPYTTMQCGTISGGVAPNTVPKDCDVSVEIRNLPQHSADVLLHKVRDFINAELLPQMVDRCADASIELRLVNDTPSYEIAQTEPLVQLLLRLTGTKRVSRVAYNTEAGLFQQTGIPTVICGPGDIAQAHRPDEYVELAQLASCERFLHLLIEDVRQYGS